MPELLNVQFLKERGVEVKGKQLEQREVKAAEGTFDQRQAEQSIAGCILREEKLYWATEKEAQLRSEKLAWATEKEGFRQERWAWAKKKEGVDKRETAVEGMEQKIRQQQRRVEEQKVQLRDRETAVARQETEARVELSREREALKAQEGRERGPLAAGDWREGGLAGNGNALAREKAELGERRAVGASWETFSVAHVAALEELKLEVEKPMIAGLSENSRAPLLVRAAEQLRALKAFAAHPAEREAEFRRATEERNGAWFAELVTAHESEVRKISGRLKAMETVNALLTSELQALKRPRERVRALGLHQETGVLKTWRSASWVGGQAALRMRARGLL